MFTDQVQELWFCLGLTFSEYGHHCLYGWWCKQQGRGSPGNDDRCWQWHGKSRLQWPTQRLMDSYFLGSQFTIPIFLCLCSRDFFNADVHSSRSVWSALQRSLFTGQIWYKGSHKINCWTKLADTEEREWSLCDRADCFLMMATGLFHGCSDTNSIALKALWFLICWFFTGIDHLQPYKALVTLGTFYVDEYCDSQLFLKPTSHVEEARFKIISIASSLLCKSLSFSSFNSHQPSESKPDIHWSSIYKLKGSTFFRPQNPTSLRLET